MFNHKDTLPTSSFHAQILGTKRWHICSDELNDPYMYEAGDVDWFNPDYVTHPLALNAECLQVDVSPGEMIYYPQNYWHQTINLEFPTISLTGSLVTKDNWELMSTKLQSYLGIVGIEYNITTQNSLLLRLYDR